MIEEKQKFYNLKNDIVFKTIIANPDDTLYLEKVLSTSLKENIEILSFSPNDLPIKNINERKKAVDVIVKTKNEVRINVEVNVNLDEATKIRNLAYYANLYSQEVEKGESYKDTLRTIQVNLNFNKDDNKEEIENYYIMNEDNHEKYTESIRIVNVNIDKVRKNWYANGENLSDELLYLVALDADKEELKKLGKNNKLIKKVGDKVATINQDDRFIRLMSEEEDRRKMLNTRILEATEKGIEKGREEGIQEGLKSGITQERLNIATSMLKDNEEIEKIIKYTDLSKEEIMEIKNKLENEFK